MYIQYFMITFNISDAIFNSSVIRIKINIQKVGLFNGDRWYDLLGLFRQFKSDNVRQLEGVFLRKKNVFLLNLTPNLTKKVEIRIK